MISIFVSTCLNLTSCHTFIDFIFKQSNVEGIFFPGAIGFLRKSSILPVLLGR